MKVVRESQWQKPLLGICVIVIGLISLVIGFTQGERKAFADRAFKATLSADLEAAVLHIRELETSLQDAELQASVVMAADDQLRGDLTALHERIEALEEEVTFYKNLMAPGELSQGLQITELEIIPGVDETFRLELLLTQKASRRQFISGQVALQLKGVDDAGNQVVKSLTELIGETSYPFRFKFRFFQDLSGNFALPKKFEPLSVTVTAKQNGKDPVISSFSWPEA